MENISVSVYDMNKQLLLKEKPLDPVSYARMLDLLSKKMADLKYVMLLNRERADYSVFKINKFANSELIRKDLAEVLSNRGEIIKIYCETDSVEDLFKAEIWIKDNNEIFMYALFDYAFGVIEVGE